MTRKFLLWLVQSYFETLCVRACRRRLADLYSTNALAMCGGVSAHRYFCAVPSPDVLGAVILRALDNFLKAKVMHMRRLINVHAGSVVRGDGHWKLARKIVQAVPGQRRPKRPWNVILAWASVDGSLLDVPRPSKGESIEEVLEDLDPVIDDLESDRLKEV